MLFREGDADYPFIVVLSGAVRLTEGTGSARRTIVTHGAGKFLGELNLLVGQAVYLSATVTEPGDVLELTPAALKRVIAQEAELSELIFKAFLSRRSILSGLGAGLKIVGSRFDPDTRRLREFAARNRLPHAWLDLETNDGADTLLKAFEVTPNETPIVVWQGDTLLKNPSTPELASAIGLSVALTDDDYDLAVMGAGPAGTSSRIENYLGFPAGLSGAELANRAQVQADKFGARYRNLTVPGTEKYEGESIHYAATEAEARTCVGDAVVVVGGGNSAGQAALFLADTAAHVYLLITRLSTDKRPRPQRKHVALPGRAYRAKRKRHLADRYRRSEACRRRGHSRGRGQKQPNR